MTDYLIIGEMNTIYGPGPTSITSLTIPNTITIDNGSGGSIPIGYSNRYLNDNYYNTGNIAIGYNATVSGISNIAIGASTITNITPSRRIKPCHKNCKVTWSVDRIHDDPIIECQVHLQLAVWESFVGHPMYYPSKLPRDLFRLIADLIKDQEKGEYIVVTPTIET